MPNDALDSVDMRLLHALQLDASQPHKQLAEACHVSEATCSRRIARLEKLGYIEKYVAVLNRRKLKLGLTLYVMVQLAPEQAPEADSFVREMRKLPYVLSMSFISGDFDYLMQMAVPDMQFYQEFSEKHLLGNARVKKYHTVFEMKALKSGGPLPVA